MSEAPEDIIEHQNETTQKKEAEEDVPADFFDDFLKEDFMAGLDVVDVDDNSSATEKSNGKAEESIPEVPAQKSELELRRDPSKTRQAIQKDKIKAAKDKKKKLITDIVQTGLVPPGMELEFDIPLSKAGKSKNGNKRSSSSTRRKRRHSRSPVDRAKRSVESPQRRHSPIYRNSTRNTSGRQQSSRSPHRRRSRSPLHRRRSRSGSFRRSRSRDRRRRFRSSNSPFKRSPKRNREKMSFLEELAVKLNEPNLPLHAPPAPSFPIHQPIHVPQGNFFEMPQQMLMAPQMPIQGQYDEQFFIGQQFMESPMDDGFPPLESALDSAIPKPLPRNQGLPGPAIPLQVNPGNPSPDVSNMPLQIWQEKIGAIQRCHHAVKLLKDAKFKPITINLPTQSNETQLLYTSPLVADGNFALSFTAPGADTPTEEGVNYQSKCENLLQQIGISQPFVPRPPVDITSTMMDAPPPPDMKPNGPIQIDLTPLPDSPTPPNKPPRMVTVGSQTKKALSQCKACQKRNEIICFNTGSQTTGPEMTFSVSTQVNESDFYSMIPKTQSLASLTPAQLLGKQFLSTPIKDSRGHQATSPVTSSSPTKFPASYMPYAAPPYQSPSDNRLPHSLFQPNGPPRSGPSYTNPFEGRGGFGGRRY